MNATSLTCYMCSAPKTSVEHVPPRGLFPKLKDLPEGRNLRKQLITVPACDLHNGEKSRDDEYLMYALVLGIQNNATASAQVKTKIMRALRDNPGVAKLITQHQKPVQVEDTTTGEIEASLAFRIDAQRVHMALDHIGRALHFHHYGEKWEGDIQVIPLFLLDLDGEAPQDFNSLLESTGRAVEELLSAQSLHGANPEVFTYKVDKPGREITVAMLLSFYEGSKVVLLFKS